MAKNKDDNKKLLSDKQLFLAISKGNEEAFRLFFDRYHQKMWSFVLTLVHSPHIAEEIVQETFIKLWECRNLLADVIKPDDFLFIMMRNHLFNTLRNLTREEKQKMQLLKQLRIADTYLDHYWMEVQEATQILEQIVARLPAQQQKVIHLSRELGLSHQEIADQLSISKHTVNEYLVAALKTCRKQLKRMGFTYFFILPPLILGSFGVFTVNDKTQIHENKKGTSGKEETVGKTVAKIQRSHLQQQ